MKTFFTFMTFALYAICVSAQAPEKMSYQAVVRNNDQLVSNQTVGMKISILKGSASGTIIYTESQTPTTNANGLISIEIGVMAGFDAIDWSDGPYFLKTETDPTGGTNYTITGTSQLLSVPYSLHAKTAASYSETDPVFLAHPSNGVSAASITNWNSAFNWGNHAVAGYLNTENDAIVGNEISSATNTTLIRSGSGTPLAPYTIGLNLGNANTWSGSQTFSAGTFFPGTGAWQSNGNVGIGTDHPLNKLHVFNGNMVIERAFEKTTLALGSVAGTSSKIFAGDASAGSLNNNNNKIILSADPLNTEEMLTLHSGADALANTGTISIHFGQFNLQNMAAIKAVNEGGAVMNRTAGLSFWTEPAGTGVPLVERMRISGNGNVGVGTPAPSAKLEVNGQVKITGGTPAAGQVLTSDASGLATWEPLNSATVNHIYFEVKRDADYNWPVLGSIQKIDFSSNSTIWKNVGNAFNVTTSTFTAPEDGIYTFNGTIFFEGLSGGGLLYAYISAGGKNYNGSWKYANGDLEGAEVSVTIFLTAGQTAQLWGYVNDAVEPAIVSGNTSPSYAFTYFTGAKVR